VTISILAFAFSLVLTSYIVMLETAVSRLSLAHIENLHHDNPQRFAALLKLAADKPKYVNGLQALTALGWATTTVLLVAAIDGLASAGSTITAVAVMTVIGFTLFGVAARTLGRQHSESIARVNASAIRFSAFLLRPFVRFLIAIGNAITPGKGFKEGPFVSAAELRELVDLASGDVIEDDERRMIHSVFELGSTVAREVMVPRTEMVWIERNKTLRQAISLSLRSGYSRIPVIGEDIDDIVGIVYLKDLAQRTFEHNQSQQTERVESIMRPVLFAPDSKSVDELLQEMQTKRLHIAILIDEYGGTAGLVTIEDIIEEIVGEIVDEYDTADEEVVEIAPHEYRVSARLHIEDLAKLIDVELDADEEGIDTVSGLLAARLGRVPIPGSTIDVGEWRLTAESVAGRRNRVGKVVVEKVASDES
jgi:CBS domain containing-hemolysin-like protein